MNSKLTNEAIVKQTFPDADWRATASNEYFIMARGTIVGKGYSKSAAWTDAKVKITSAIEQLKGREIKL